MMELGLDVFKDQGVAFWSAAGAIALGLTILAVCGFVYFRNVLTRTFAARRGVPTEPAAKIAGSVANEDAAKTDVPDPKAPAEDPTPRASLDETDLVDLLSRLQKTAERLEDLRSVAQSPLKHTVPDVEYVFKKGVG